MLSLVIATITSKAASFLSIIVLGWYLSSEEFAIYALASSCAAVFIAIRNGGIQQILIQRGERSFSLLNGYFFKYALWFNVLGMLVLIGCAPLLAKAYNNDEIINLIIIISLSLPLSSFSMLYRSKLSIDHKFTNLAKLDSFSSLIRQGSSAAFAFFGFGVYSFVYPIILSGLFEIVCGLYYVGRIQLNKRKFTKRVLLGLFENGKWVIFASLATAFILQGDYMVIGFFESKDIVGQYFFGFQLTMAISVVITSGLQSVLMPIFSRLNTDVDRQEQAFCRAFQLYTYAVLTFSCLLIITAEPLINELWHGKWNQSILVVQIIAASMSTRLLTPLGRSLLEARRKWKLTSILLAFDAVGVISATLIGVFWGSLYEITISVAIYRFVYGIAYLLIMAKSSKITIKQILRPLWSSLFSSTISVMYVFFIYQDIIQTPYVALNLILIIAAFMSTQLIITRLIDRNMISNIFQFIKR